MNDPIQKIRNFRHFLLNQISHLTTEQLNLIPAGYRNNIIWNLAHLIAAQQSLCYVRAGLLITVDDSYFSPYLPTTKPDRFVDDQTISAIKDVLITSLSTLQTDFDRHIFSRYTHSERIASIYGVEVNNIDDALAFLLFHEGYHTGYILAMKHLV